MAKKSGPEPPFIHATSENWIVAHKRWKRECSQFIIYVIGGIMTELSTQEWSLVYLKPLNYICEHNKRCKPRYTSNVYIYR